MILDNWLILSFSRGTYILNDFFHWTLFITCPLGVLSLVHMFLKNFLSPMHGTRIHHSYAQTSHFFFWLKVSFFYLVLCTVLHYIFFLANIYIISMKVVTEKHLYFVVIFQISQTCNETWFYTANKNSNLYIKYDISQIPSTV